MNPAPTAVLPPLVEPGSAPDQWDESTREAAEADDAYWEDAYSGEPDDPSDHYYCC